MKRLLPWLRLLRIGNGFSPLADVVAGAVLARGDLGSAPVLRTALASLCVYLAGMVWNDVADRDTDRQERPERPLPRGDIPVWAACLLGVALLLAALVLAPASQRLLVAFLVLGVLAYDFLARSALLAGATVLGLLRALNLGLGVLAGLTAGAADDRVPHQYWLLAGAYFVYIASLTALAAHEQRRPGPALLATLHVLPLLAQGMVAWSADQRLWAALLVVPFAAALGRALLTALADPGAKAMTGSVTLLLLGILVFDAAIVAGTGRWLVALWILACFPVARWIGRRIALT